MTEPSKTTSAKVHAKAAATKAAEAASEATEAVNETTQSIGTGIRNGFMAVRDNVEVQKLTQGVRMFARRAEDPALIVATAINPLAGLGLTGIVKGTRLVSRGLKAEGTRPLVGTDSDK